LYELYLINDNAFLKDFLNGFTKNPKTLMPKYFYDDRGSNLFSKITGTDEYYLTRVEQQIFHDNISDIASFIPDKSIILDYGGADPKKFSFIFPHLKNPIGYLPIDISDNHMQYNISQMHRKYPDLIIQPIHSDFTKPIIIPPIDNEYNNVVGFFLGSSLGNFLSIIPINSSPVSNLFNKLSAIFNPSLSAPIMIVFLVKNIGFFCFT